MWLVISWSYVSMWLIISWSYVSMWLIMSCSYVSRTHIMKLRLISWSHVSVTHGTMKLGVYNSSHHEPVWLCHIMKLRISVTHHIMKLCINVTHHIMKLCIYVTHCIKILSTSFGALLWWWVAVGYMVSLFSVIKYALCSRLTFSSFKTASEQGHKLTQEWLYCTALHKCNKTKRAAH